MAFYYGPYPYWGLYNPNFTYPILQSDYKLSGLFNEYDELNDLAIKNNMLYAQNLAEDSCNSRAIKPPPKPPLKPPGSPRDFDPHYNYYPYYNYPYYNYPGYPYYNYPYSYPYPGYYPYYL